MQEVAILNPIWRTRMYFTMAGSRNTKVGTNFDYQEVITKW